MTPVEAERLTTTAFEGLGGDLIDPAVLMPAARPLDVSGEAVRTRLCVFSDATGQETALRPDLTLPVAEAEADRLANNGKGEQVYRYAARAFRLPSSPGQPMEFVQVGFERFGAAATPQADADAFGAVVSAIDSTGAPVDRILLGDLAVFDAFVAAIEVPKTTGDALRRAFRLQGGVDALLSDPEPKAKQTSLIQPGTSQVDAEALVEQMLSLSGAPLVGGRSVTDIATRLREKASGDKADGLSAEFKALLKSVLNVSGAPQSCVEALSKISKEHGLSGVDTVLMRLADRMDKVSEKAGAMELTFETSFGRRFNYYDGFVFEVFAPGAPNALPMGAGGRYDSLIDRLSTGAVQATGIGGVVRPDRLSAALGGAA